MRLKRWAIATIYRAQAANWYSVMTIRHTSLTCRVFRITSIFVMPLLPQASLIYWMFCKKRKSIVEVLDANIILGLIENNPKMAKLRKEVLASTKKVFKAIK